MTYDAFSNKISSLKNDGSTDYFKYDLNKKLLSRNNDHFKYDGRGNLIESKNDHSKVVYTYDLNNQMLSQDTNGQVVKYEYIIL